MVAALGISVLQVSRFARRLETGVAANSGARVANSGVQAAMDGDRCDCFRRWPSVVLALAVLVSMVSMVSMVSLTVLAELNGVSYRWFMSAPGGRAPESVGRGAGRISGAGRHRRPTVDMCRLCSSADVIRRTQGRYCQGGASDNGVGALRVPGKGGVVLK